MTLREYMFLLAVPFYQERRPAPSCGVCVNPGRLSEHVAGIENRSCAPTTAFRLKAKNTFK